jgi:tetratricopeptide (TPR) repeat protein
MRKKILILVIVIPLLLLLTAISFYAVKKYNVIQQKTKLYREGLKTIYDKDNPFCSEARLAYLDSLLQSHATGYREVDAQLLKATTLLKLGREKEAVDLLKDVTAKLKPGNNQSDETRAKSLLALAYLRLGERNNCINNHSSESCIFPIREKGIYIDPFASQKAIGIFEELIKQDSNDLDSRWLLNIAYMTIGEYPGSVPAQWLIPGLDTASSSYKVKPFGDMASDLHLDGSRSMAGGSIVDDFDNDGYLDIVTSSWGLEESMHYFKNNGDGSFTDLSKSSGLSAIKGGLNLIQADFNNDGYTDILVLRGAWYKEYGKQPNTLLRNNGDGTFTDVTIESGILSFHPTQTATWADFNNDGWLDLFIGNETTSQNFPHPSELYINNQDGTFTNVASQAGCELTGFMKGVVSADYNKDGWPDIFISTQDGIKILLKNKGIKGKIPQFENATHEAGLDKDETYTFPTWFWDYDNDGWPDIFACGYDNQLSLAAIYAAEALNRPLPNVSKMYLYHNNHDGTFSNISKEVGLDKPVYAMGANFGDIDNDGWSDMYLGTGNPDFRSLIPNKMFKNIEGKQFVDITGSARVGNLQKGHGVAFADIDNDGDQDIFIRVGGASPGDGYYNSLYVNPGQNENKWISILLEGTKSNRSAIGAHIAVSFTENEKKRTVYMDVNSGGSFGANPLRKEIGIGRADKIDQLTIKWPGSGTVQEFNNVAPDQFIKIKEGNNHFEKMNLKLLTFKEQKGKMNAISCGIAPF